MRKNALKLKKGGIDTIIAYIVVIMPLLYVLIYMVATIYHFSVQTYMDQLVKETLAMASAYGDLTVRHESNILDDDRLKKILGETAEGKANCKITYYKRDFDEEEGTCGDIGPAYMGGNSLGLDKADIVGVYVESDDDSLLGKVSSFSLFFTQESDKNLKYASYREEIIRNEKPKPKTSPR